MMVTMKHRMKWWQFLICLVFTLIGLAASLIILTPFLLGEILGSLAIPQLLEQIKTAL